MILADGFASSTAGYLTGVGTPVIAGMFGYFWLQVAGKFRRIEQSAVETNRALAVLIRDSEVTQVAVESDSKRINTLEISTAVLKTMIDNHEKWHERAQRKGD